MADSLSNDFGIPLSDLPPQEKAKRAGSFGAVASLYERFRPGPPPAAVDWILPRRRKRVVDLGAGTGALTRLLIDKADEVVAVEPDERMRAVLAQEVPAARVVDGRGEALPLPDGTVDAVIASSSWHWMDPVPTLGEVARVLVPDGIVAALWSGPDPDGAFMVQAREILAQQSRPAAGGDATAAGDAGASELSGMILGDATRPVSSLEIPPGLGFDQPEHGSFSFDVALNADELIGLLGTLSWIITMDEEKRERLFSEARRLLRELLGIEGEVTVDVAFRADVWRASLSH